MDEYGHPPLCVRTRVSCRVVGMHGYVREACRAGCVYVGVFVHVGGQELYLW